MDGQLQPCQRSSKSTRYPKFHPTFVLSIFVCFNFHVNRVTGVFVAAISTAGFTADVLTIKFANQVVRLPVWTDGAGTLVFAVADAARVLRLERERVQQSEWLVIDDIPLHLLS